LTRPEILGADGHGRHADDVDRYVATFDDFLTEVT
jgi:hypothetical protein